MEFHFLGADSLGLIQTDFDDLLKKSDFVTVSCQLSDKTRHMFNKEAFSKMKDDAILVNTSRYSLGREGVSAGHTTSATSPRLPPPPQATGLVQWAEVSRLPAAPEKLPRADVKS